jgi:hypothetical protein
MLTIRSTQMATLDQQAEQVFVHQLADYLRNTHANVTVRTPVATVPIAEMTAPALLELVSIGVDRARTYQLTWQSSLAAFVVLMFLAAPNFDRHPHVRQILEDTSVGSEDRVDEVCQQLPAAAWRQIRERYDSSDWNMRTHA